MNKTVFATIFTFLLIHSAAAQNSDSAGEAFFYHKKNLWKNFQTLNNNAVESGLQREFDALYYRLELEIQFEPQQLSGKVTGRYKSTKKGLSRIVLDFDHHMQITTVNGLTTGYVHSGQLLTIDLQSPLSEGDIFEITVEYSGVPDAGIPSRWFVFDKLPDGSDLAWTLSEPYGARYWWPCKDSPRDKADSVDIIVTVPDKQLVASNGTLISDRSAEGKKTFHWREKYPIATYLVSLAVAPYVHFSETVAIQENDSLLLDYYVYPADEQQAREIFPNTKSHLRLLEQRFGPYPFSSEKYGLAQFGWTSGAMEHQTISSVGRVRSSWEYVYVHELGHQWFGDALTCASWTDMWLNEGFASYSEALYAELAGFNGLQPGKASYKEYMQRQSYLADGILKVQDTLNLGSLFGSIVYNKGSWVLHMLRGLLGDDDFFSAIYDYANGPLQFSSVSTADFKAVCEKVSGKDLERFFEQWLDYPYFPHYVFSWEKTESSFGEQARISLNILQRQNTVIYEMPVDLKFVFPDGPDSIITVDNYLREQNYSFEFDTYPVEVIFDPDNWILKDVQERSGGVFLPETMIENIYPNPARNVVNIDVIFWGQTELDLKIFDINGRLVNRLRPYLFSKSHRYYFKWNNDDRDGNPVAAGVYFLKAANKDYPAGNIKKVIILK